MSRRIRGRKLWPVWSVVLAALLLSAGMAPLSAGATIVVNSNADRAANDGRCTLREAITAANLDSPSGGRQGECDAGSGDDTIDLTALDGVIELTGVLPHLEGNVVLEGPGANRLTIRRGPQGGDYRILEVRGGVTVTLSGLTISNGRVPDGQGGGILNSGTLTLSECAVSDNSAYDGGGIASEGTIVLEGSTVGGNEATGGGSFAAEGGGIYVEGVLELKNSTVSNNRARDFGGGIYVADATSPGTGSAVRLTNSSVISNSAMHGGGIGIGESSIVELNYGTISGNEAFKVGEFGGVGGGFHNAAGVVISKGTLIAENIAPTAGADCYNIATLHSLGYSLVGDDNGCDWPVHAHDIVNVDPRLGPLLDNGGPTQTRALLPGSPALDAIPVESCTDPSETPVTRDQRGIPRPQGSGCDIGSFEAVPTDADLRLTKRVSPVQAYEGDPVVFSVEVANLGPLDATGVVVSDSLSAGLSLVSSEPSQGAYDAQTALWAVGSVPVSRRATLTLTVSVDAGTAGTNLSNSAAVVAADQPDPNPDNNGTAVGVTILERLAIYVPAMFNEHVPPVAFPVLIGRAIPVRPIDYQGQVFYRTSVRIPDKLPTGGAFYLSPRPTGVAEGVVDDELAILLGESQVFAFDYSTSGRPTPAVVQVPRSTMEQTVGQTVTIEYRDVYAALIGASEMWLVWTP